MSSGNYRDDGGGFTRSPLAGAGISTAEKQQTTIQRLNSILDEKLEMLRQNCSRLESFADRLEPTPKPAEDAKKEPPLNHDLQGMNQRLSNLGNSLEWLNQICTRLEHIA